LSPPANECPNDKFLNKYVRDKVCEKWRDLGIELMGQDAVPNLNVTRANHCNDVSECCSRMFTLWRQRTPKANWKQLIEALKEVNLNHLASELEGLSTPSVECYVEQENTISHQQQLEKHQIPSQELGGACCNVNLLGRLVVVLLGPQFLL